MRATLTVFMALCLMAGATSVAAARTQRDNPIRCDADRSYIFVQVRKNRLALCEDGRVVGQYRAAMGAGGYGKRRQNDRKTPIGDYPLGPPRPSRSGFHTFIPVLYPSESQRRAGYTGGAIGIHGPTRWARPLGRVSTIRNWTDGCVALGADREIEEIASWVMRRQIVSVSIRP